MFQDVAAALEHAMPLFDAPAPAIPLEAFAGLFGGGQRDRGQQEPFDGGSPLRSVRFHDVKSPQLERGPVTQLRRLGRTDRHFLEAQLDLRLARRQPRTSGVLAFGQVFTLAGHRQLHPLGQGRRG